MNRMMFMRNLLSRVGQEVSSIMCRKVLSQLQLEEIKSRTRTADCEPAIVSPRLKVTIDFLVPCSSGPVDRNDSESSIELPTILIT